MKTMNVIILLTAGFMSQGIYAAPDTCGGYTVISKCENYVRSKQECEINVLREGGQGNRCLWYPIYNPKNGEPNCRASQNMVNC